MKIDDIDIVVECTVEDGNASVEFENFMIEELDGVY